MGTLVANTARVAPVGGVSGRNGVAKSLPKHSRRAEMPHAAPMSLVQFTPAE